MTDFLKIFRKIPDIISKKLPVSRKKSLLELRYYERNLVSSEILRYVKYLLAISTEYSESLKDIRKNNRTSETLAELIFLAFFKLSIWLNPDQYHPVSPDMLLWMPIVIFKPTLSFPSCFENTYTDIHAAEINFS